MTPINPTIVFQLLADLPEIEGIAVDGKAGDYLTLHHGREGRMLQLVRHLPDGAVRALDDPRLTRLLTHVFPTAAPSAEHRRALLRSVPTQDPLPRGRPAPVLPLRAPKSAS